MDTMEPCDVLLVDDSPTVLGMLSDLLTAWGHRVRTAENGAAALHSIAERLPDLVLLDVMMPEMNGYEVCKVMRREYGAGEYLPVLMLTAAGDVSRSLAAGADDFIAKPPDHAELLARVQNLLRLRSLHRALREKNCALEAMNTQLYAQNEQLEAMAGQLEAQNQELEAMAGQLQAQNQQLEAMTRELEAANQRLAHLSVTDGLTQAHNHRHFQERLRSELARATRHDTPLSCVLLDIDRFKDVNDTHGHRAGDGVLKGLVEILRQSVRDEDVV
ncbi:MAG: response regulator, partial [Proteobacteria bacterium]|nr:response regulator [Pseudomonadota bacterium]